MMAASKLFQIVFLIISINHISSNNSNDGEAEIKEACKNKPVPPYFLTDQKSLEMELYYDAGGLVSDSGFILSMCEARKNFKKVTFKFSVGVDVLRGTDGKLVCVTADKNNKGCKNSYIDACASKLVLDFTELLCCVYTSGGMPVEKCFKNQSSKVDEFQQCINLQHPTIKPDEILVANAHNAAQFAGQTELPFLAFNGKTDECARVSFDYHPEKVICAVLAQGVEEACNQNWN